jgi:cell division protein FtsI (penicillin-binding protein 3)
MTLTGILAQSSNIGAIKVAQKLGPARLMHYLQAFGLGQDTHSGLPGESSGVLLPMSQWSGTTLPTLAFGQGGIEVTALQMASVYATIANNGVRVQPSIVEGTVDSSGSVQAAPAPTRTRVVSAHTARLMREMLQSVTTEEGTAPEASIPGYAVAGKTGTANQPNGTHGYVGGGYVSSFIGMVPAKNPQLVGEVVLEKPKGDHFGGSVAGPVFHTVMSFALQSLGIAPTGDHRPTIPLTW